MVLNTLRDRPAGDNAEDNKMAVDQWTERVDNHAPESESSKENDLEKHAVTTAYLDDSEYVVTAKTWAVVVVSSMTT